MTPPDDPAGTDPVDAVERSLVRLRRSQTRRSLARRAGSVPGAPTPEVVEVLDAVAGAAHPGPRDTAAGATAAAADAAGATADEAAAGTSAGAGPVTVGVVADRLGIDPSRASRRVAAAVDAGHLRRTVSPGDARRTGLVLSPSGEAVLAAVRRTRRGFVADVLADWTPADRATFAVLLARFTDRLGPPDADGATADLPGRAVDR
jgi:DNA-binding MarR family transcriptional regulator